MNNVKPSRDSAYAYLVYLIDGHNGNHDSPSDNFDKPTKTPHTISISSYSFNCGGGCGMTMDSPISSHLERCGSVPPPGYWRPDYLVEGCSKPYYICNNRDVEYHQVLYCGVDVLLFPNNYGNTSSILGVCGAGYRKCTESTLMGSHRFGYIRVNNGASGSYASGVKTYRSSPHSKGRTTPWPNALNGPDGAGYGLDKTPGCNVCLDGSGYCPNASAHSTQN